MAVDRVDIANRGARLVQFDSGKLPPAIEWRYAKVEYNVGFATNDERLAETERERLANEYLETTRKQLQLAKLAGQLRANDLQLPLFNKVRESSDFMAVVDEVVAE